MSGVRASRPAYDRMMEKVRVDESGCWIFGGSIRKGYGVVGVGKSRIVSTHRVAYEHHNGPIENGLCVCHRCDNPLCVNPSHLFLGTNDDNMRDMISKGRHSAAPGERNARAKLSGADVAQIRLILAKRTHRQRDIAEMFGVSSGAISSINVGRHWPSPKPSDAPGNVVLEGEDEENHHGN